MIFEKLASIIAAQFNIDQSSITRETSFTDDLNADSLDVVELLMSIEEEFNLSDVEESGISGISTVGDVEDFIAEHTEQ